MEGQDGEGRQKAEREIYAPPEGWDAAEANLFRRILTAEEE